MSDTTEIKALRTEAQIDEVLAAVKDVWLKNPGMRLTQVVTWIAKIDYDATSTQVITEYPATIGYDHTYVEDDEWVEKAERYPY